MSNINESEEMVYLGAEHWRYSVVQMLQKRVPDYHNQFVVWLDFNLFTAYKFHRMDAKIELLDADGRVLMESDTSDAKNELGVLLRNPYPNKNITQLGSKRGRSRIYGLPLVFDTYEEIELIKSVRVTWTVYKPVWFGAKMTEEPCSMMVEQVVVDVKTNFVRPSSDDKCWYTLHFQDRLARELDENYASEEPYEVLAGYDGDIVLDDDTFEDMSRLDEWWNIRKDDTGFQVVDILDFLEKMLWNKHMILKSLSEINPVCKLEVNYHRCCYVVKTDVYAKVCADFIASASFGFSH